MKPVEYYLNLPPELVDMNDPDTPESVKIAARIALENERDAILAQEESQRTQEVKSRLKVLLSILSAAISFLQNIFK